MAQKLNIKYVGIALFIVLCSTLLILNLESFKQTTIRLLEILDIHNLKNWFQRYTASKNIIIDEITKDANTIIDKIREVIESELDIKGILLNLFVDVLIFILNFLNYFVNIGINIIFVLMLFFNETFNGTNLSIKYTKPTQIFIKIQQVINFVINKIKQGVITTCKWLNRSKRSIAIIILLTLISNGILYAFITEVIIFLITYVFAAINMEVYIVLTNLVEALFVFLYPYLKNISKIVLFFLLLFLILIKAFQRANYRLTKNHSRLKKFANEKLTQTTFINGAPGVGKTLLNVSLSLASEENIIEELEEKMRQYQTKYPYLNFANIRVNPTSEEHLEYVKLYDFLQARSTYLISNFSIYSPYFKDYSKIFDFNFMRKNIKSDVYALEQYTVISISELDKEYNSHDDMKAVGEDGAATFFSTISHDLKRTVKVFCDYQLKDQVPLRIRGNSEYFITIKSRKKKYPMLLYLYYLPIILFDKLINKLIKKYETKRQTITRKTKRKSISTYKRNDYTFIYAVLRLLQHRLRSIKAFFDHYWYFKLTTLLSQEDGGKGTQVSINLNLCDLKLDGNPLYDSTFLSYAYEQKKNMRFKDLPTYTSLTPSIDELTKNNSRFYNKINGINLESLAPKDKKSAEKDDFIDV